MLQARTAVWDGEYPRGGGGLPVMTSTMDRGKQMKTYTGAGSSWDIALDAFLDGTAHGGGVGPRGGRVLVGHAGLQNLKSVIDGSRAVNWANGNIKSRSLGEK